MFDQLREELKWAMLAFKRIAQNPRTPKAMREIAESRAACIIKLLEASSLCEDEGCGHFGTPHVCT